MKGKIFNVQEVQSILNGSKVMFREVIKPQPNSNMNPVKLDYLLKTWQWGTKESRRECPYQVGQKIFCKETFCEVKDEQFGEENWIDYRATPKYAESHPAGWDNEPENPDALKWKPAQYMKQEHSRLTLQIKEIKVERLAEISRGDCMTEGCPFPNIAKETNPKEWLKDSWNATHKKPEEKFEGNPWVWVVEFKKI